MKKFLVLAVAVFFAVCCNPFKTATYTDEIAMPLADGRADSLIVDVSLEYVVKAPEEGVAEAMNRAILSVAFDLEDEPGSVEETVLRYREELIDAYLTENGEREDGVLSWEDHVHGLFQSEYKGFRTYIVDYYGYRGGAHGIGTLVPIVFDKATGTVLSESDLFTEGFEAPVSGLIRTALAASMSERTGEPAEVEEGLPVLNGAFGVDTDGVTWYYQPYEIAPYAMGLLTATVFWDDLKPWLLQR